MCVFVRMYIKGDGTGGWGPDRVSVRGSDMEMRGAAKGRNNRKTERRELEGVKVHLLRSGVVFSMKLVSEMLLS